jgi:hypothetical protein
MKVIAHFETWKRAVNTGRQLEITADGELLVLKARGD